MAQGYTPRAFPQLPTGLKGQRHNDSTMIAALTTFLIRTECPPGA
jgi:hypothetical protein